MKVYLTLLLVSVLQILSSSALPLDGQSFGCGFDDNDLIENVTSRSPHSTGTWFRWKDGKIPYYFKGNVNDGDKELTRDIMDEIEAHTCFKYLPRDSEPEEHHLEILVESPTCYRNGFSAYVQPQSYTKVLLRSFKQLTGHETCDNRGGFIHEMMHALGVGHTQKRADRDKYIILNDDNIQKMSQYAICHECKLYGDVPYDCSSIMHYGQGTFSTGWGKNTMEARDPNTCKLSWGGPAFEGEKKPAPSDWKLLGIIAEKVCDMKAPRWLTWSEWSACSEPCGDGRKTRKRTCLVPGKCEGENQQETKCSIKDTYKEPEKCPTWKNDCKEEKWKDWMQKWCAQTCNCGDGEATWSSWGAWSGCSASCGDGTKTRSRTCSIEGKCPGESQQTNKCDLPKCDSATWSSWGDWSGCSASCGDGTKTRSRTCSIEGKCPGESQQTNKCDLPKCDSATWSSWGDWSGCSASCGDGTKTRTRTCPIEGKCPGESQQTNKCDLPKCATWSSWSAWSGCSASCGDGTKTRSRTCSIAGKCSGESQQTNKCDLPKCATWSSWSVWSGCSATCGDGTKSRTRTCEGAGKCQGDDQQTNKCDLPKCDSGGCVTDKGACIFPFTYKSATYNGCTVAHHNQAWCQTKDSWGNCPSDCKMHIPDEGTCETSNGACIFPFTYRGNTYNGCTKDGWDRAWCQTRADGRGTWWGVCPAECQMHKDSATWSSWGAWSGCSASCGDGTKTRTRTCPIQGKCPGESQETNKCDLPKCDTTACKTTTGYDCVFPFFYDGTRYDECSAVGPFGDRKICAIKVNANNEFMDGYWGYCQDNC